MSALIDPGDLCDGLRLFDVRMGPDAAEAYRAAHLEGAHFVDVERDLSGDASDPARGGRHPLPSVRAFSQTLGRLGVTPETDVVVYDDASGAKAAARAWWMLRAVGHARVRVLDGGMQAALAAGWPASAEIPTRIPAPPYPASAWALPTVELGALEDALARGAVLLDVRSAARFRGEAEPFDPPGGHIPGAINVPLTESLDASGRFLPPEALRARFAEALGEPASRALIVSCGSGITACHTLLALEHAGISGAALYVGSFSEWSRAGRPGERA